MAAVEKLSKVNALSVSTSWPNPTTVGAYKLSGGTHAEPIGSRRPLRGEVHRVGFWRDDRRTERTLAWRVRAAKSCRYGLRLFGLRLLTVRAGKWKLIRSRHHLTDTDALHAIAIGLNLNAALLKNTLQKTSLGRTQPIQ